MKQQARDLQGQWQTFFNNIPEASLQESIVQQWEEFTTQEMRKATGVDENEDEDEVNQRRGKKKEFGSSLPLHKLEAVKT